MPKPFTIRLGWMRFMYVYTIVGAGGFGLGIIFAPDAIRAAFRWPPGEPIAMSIMGSIYVAFGALSVLGLRDPLKFAPVLLLQLCYKSVWLAAVVVPMVVTGRFPGYGLVLAGIFATYVIGDLIAIPFPYLFASASIARRSADGAS